jgi:aspartyl-tRNA(Asn)/glutamyl-tRNA(Gln) amidotransferase subunit C
MPEDPRARLSAAEIARLAALARLSLEEREAAGLERDLAQILEYMRALDRVAAEGPGDGSVEPAGPDALREDLAEEGAAREDALGGAPERDGGFFTVPAVVERP